MSETHLIDRRRATLLTLMLFAAFSVLISQFYRLQVIEHDKWQQRALKQHEGVVRLSARRGTFFSNVSIKEGHPEVPQAFAVDVPKFHLHADPAVIPAELRDPICKQIAQLFEVDPEHEGHVRQQLDLRSRNRELLRWLDRDDRDQLLEWWIPFARQHHLPRNALFFVPDYQRSYPFGKLLGSVLHTIRDHKDEVTKQGIPTGGLEAYFHEILNGQEGAQLVVHSPRKRLDLGRVLQAPQDGADVTLTINHYLQAIAEEELERGVRQAQAKGGFALLMDPYTGEILALAQVPEFWPERYRDYFNSPERISDTLCQAISYAYEPGSIMKPLMMALCLEANRELQQRGQEPLFSPEEKVATGDGSFPGRSKPLKDLGRVHQFLNLDMAIQKSSNVYMARIVERLVERLGDEWLHDALRYRLHMGEKTGIELPGESSGFVPTPGRQHANGALEWSKATPFSLAMGYNLQVNAVQMLRAWSMIANGGYCIKPTLVRRIERKRLDGSTEVLFDLTQQLQSSVPVPTLSPTSCQRILRALKFVTKRGGSGGAGDISGFTEVGKSGTSEKLVNGQYAADSHFSSFIGIVPADHPRFVVQVSIDEPRKQFLPGIGGTHYGGKCAAPVFCQICKRSLAYLGVSPDDPFGYPVGDPRRDSERADWNTEVKQLQKMYDSWNALSQ